MKLSFNDMKPEEAVDPLAELDVIAVFLSKVILGVTILPMSSKRYINL
jgi:hypothetical protein